MPDAPLIDMATTRQLLEEVCARLEEEAFQEACGVAALAFRLPEELLVYRTATPWWSESRARCCCWNGDAMCRECMAGEHETCRERRIAEVIR